MLLLLRTQVGLVYFFGGVAKLNPDWLRGEPMRYFLGLHADSPVLGALVERDWVIYAFAYGGLLLDLTVVPFLLWRKSRPWAFSVALLFHLTNAWLFTLDIFPWFMIAATTLFFSPDWPRRVAAWFSPRPAVRGPAARAEPTRTVAPLRARERVLVGALAVYVALHVLVPLRSLLYPGNTLWTSEGQRFAWRMMLSEKRAETWFALDDLEKNRHTFVDPRQHMSAEEALALAHDPKKLQEFATFLARDWAPKQGWPHVSVRRVDSFLRFYVVPTPGAPRELVQTPKYLTLYQQEKMSWYPDCMLQFAHHLRDEQRRRGFPHAQVFLEAWVSLNGRRHQLLVDPEVDLARVQRSLAPAAWLRPLNEPLR
jgi:hypothetical protein